MTVNCILIDAFLFLLLIECASLLVCVFVFTWVCVYVKVCPCVYGFKWQLKGRVKRPIWRSETWAIISLSLSMCVSVCVSMCMSDCLLLTLRVSYWPVNMLSYTLKPKLHEYLISLTNICFAALHHRQSYHPSLKMKKRKQAIHQEPGDMGYGTETLVSSGDRDTW